MTDLDHIAQSRGIPALSEAEMFKTAWLRHLEYPRDKVTIERLAPQDFDRWLYGINPRDAFILAATHLEEFKRIKWRKQSVLCRMFDCLWRVYHGYA